jgi:hypothetical protein
MSLWYGASTSLSPIFSKGFQTMMCFLSLSLSATNENVRGIHRELESVVALGSYRKGQRKEADDEAVSVGRDHYSHTLGCDPFCFLAYFRNRWWKGFQTMMCFLSLSLSAANENVRGVHRELETAVALGSFRKR